MQSILDSLHLSQYIELDEVQTTDSYQGQAADHVIVSTVRSDSAGLLWSPKRANVTFT